MATPIQTIKFSQFTNGGGLLPSGSFAGILNSQNTLFTTFPNLPPGTTSDRPAIDPSMYYRLRFNTTLGSYEYYNPTVSMWVELSGSGTGTVNPGPANSIAFYAASGTTLSPIVTANNSVLVTDNSGIPSLSNTLPSGLNIPNASITASTASLLSGQIIATPTNPTDIVNKSYVDSLIAAGVLSLTGTVNQVNVSAPTGNIVLSLQQDIATTSDVIFNSVAFSNTTHGIVGTTTNDNAAAGYVGELLTASASGINLTTGVVTNIVSLAVPGGDYDAWGVVEYQSAAGTTTTVFSTCVNNVSATLSSKRTQFSGLIFGTGADNFFPSPADRFSFVVGGGTIYLIGFAAFSGGTMTCSGNIIARRRR